MFAHTFCEAEDPAYGAWGTSAHYGGRSLCSGPSARRGPVVVRPLPHVGYVCHEELVGAGSDPAGIFEQPAA